MSLDEFITWWNMRQEAEDILRKAGFYEVKPRNGDEVVKWVDDSMCFLHMVLGEDWWQRYRGADEKMDRPATQEEIQYAKEIGIL